MAEQTEFQKAVPTHLKTLAELTLRTHQARKGGGVKALTKHDLQSQEGQGLAEWTGEDSVLGNFLKVLWVSRKHIALDPSALMRN